MNPADFRAEVRELLEERRVTVEPHGSGFIVRARGGVALFVARLLDVTASDLR